MQIEHSVWRTALSRGEQQGSDAISAIIGGAADESFISFAAGFPDVTTFAVNAMSAGFPQVAADTRALQYGPTAGLAGPRDWLAGRLAETDGRRPADDELMITSGGMEALTLVSEALLTSEDLALVEQPTFLGAIMALRSRGPRLRGLPMDEDGLDVPAVAALLQRERPALLYVIPDHHNPTGVTLGIERRHALVELARRHGVLLVEDVAYRDLGFDGARLPSLWSLAPETCVQIGTFSKTFTPGFRLGWAAGPAPLVRALIRVKQTTDQCASPMGQLLLERYGRSGEFDRAVHRMRAVYAGRCAEMTAALDDTLPDGVRHTRPYGGFFTWLTVDGVAPAALLDAALAEGVGYVPGEVFHLDDDGGTRLRLAFSHAAPADIPEGVARLGRAITAARR